MSQTMGLLSPLLARWRNGKVVRLISDRARVLDLGCGEAGVLRALYRCGKRAVTYVGVDRQPDCIRANRDRYPGHRFVAWDFDQQGRPPVQGPFEFITMIAVVEHLRAPDRLFQWIATLLGPEGRLIITTPHRGGEGIYSLGVHLGLFSKEAHEEHNEVFPDRDWLEELAGKAGLEMKVYRKFMFGYNQLAVFARL